MTDKTDILDFDQKYGYVQVPNVLVLNMSKLQLSGNELALLIIIRMFAYQRNYSFPSLKTLQKISGLSHRGVIYIIKTLENKGYLEIKRISQKNNFYSFKPLNDLLEKIMNNNIDEEVVKNFDYPSANFALPPVQNLHPNKKNINKNKNTHTKKEEKESVCDEIKKTKTFQNTEPAIIENLLQKNGEKAVIAAKYIEKTFAGQAIRNPAGLLIKTLERGTYSELPQETRNLASIKADIERLNDKYKGFSVFQGEKITEISNIGGRIAFRTNDITKDMTVTPAKSYEEFETYLNRQKGINSS
ncbi:MAG: helix-turn-helix domain-containing protein [Candidatus Acidulodesulfobacterium ferriphilum]|uniref:Helix-turn-helix domain-containing protein n=1 Tax=Candidatus Acidulodesulfobacterium ferriphilum TaxID=2597223 RepID=A0A519BAL3_9DELT|nr:MAG: helix-turn-helix domain-containing protein [Candidatus Acidulodesulfobacterium ferriphilum]